MIVDSDEEKKTATHGRPHPPNTKYKKMPPYLISKKCTQTKLPCFLGAFVGLVETSLMFITLSRKCMINPKKELRISFGPFCKPQFKQTGPGATSGILKALLPSLFAAVAEIN